MLVEQIKIDKKAKGLREHKVVAPNKKTPVLGMIERGGNLVAKVVPNAQPNTLKPIIEKI